MPREDEKAANPPAAGGMEDDEPALLGPEHACPECDNYYCLSIEVEPMPWLLAEQGTDQEQEEWEAGAQDISICSVCGWRSDSD